MTPATGSLDAKRFRLKYSTDYNGSGIEQEYIGNVKADGGVEGEVKNRLSSGVFQGAPLTTEHDLNLQVWRFDVGFSEDIHFNLLCSLRVDDGRLKGPCAVTDGVVLQTSGEANGANVTFAYDAQVHGQPLHVSYSGAVQTDGSLKGSIKAGETSGVFTARRP